MKRTIALWVLFSASRISGQDLCAGLVTDKAQHPMTALAKPAVGVLATDPQFGGKFRRITAVKAVGQDPFIKPMYSPVPAWNADESYVLLYAGSGTGEGGWWLYDGTTYAPIRRIDVAPADVEQLWWDTTNPKVVYWPSAGEHRLYATNVDTDSRTVVHDFSSICSAPYPAGGYLYGDSHSGVSWDTDLFGFACGQKSISYRKSTDAVVVSSAYMDGSNPQQAVKPLPTPSGKGFLVVWRSTNHVWHFAVTDAHLVTVRELDIREPSHYSMGWKADGRETFNIVTFDGGPLGSGVGSLVVFHLDDGSSAVVIGQSTGYLYPRSDTHVSGTAFRRRGWLWQSHGGGCNSTTYCPNANPPNSYQGETAPVPPKGIDLLDNEITITDTNTGKTCRVMHHRSHGKFNKTFAQPYWGEPHVTASPSGTRAVFGSDWGGGPTVDTYVIELPSYKPGAAGATPPKDHDKGGGNNDKKRWASKPPSEAPDAYGVPLLDPGRAAPTARSPLTTTESPSGQDNLASTQEPSFGVGGESGYSFAARQKATQTENSAAQGPPRPFLSTPGAAKPRGSSAVGGPQSATRASAPNTVSAGSWFSRGIAELAAGQYEKAVDSLRAAVREDPWSAAAHYYLGYTYYLMSKQEPRSGDNARKASEHIAQAYRIDPEFKPARER